MEASPEQMARCAAFAERFSQQSNTLTRVIGWCVAAARDPTEHIQRQSVALLPPRVIAEDMAS